MTMVRTFRLLLFMLFLLAHCSVAPGFAQVNGGLRGTVMDKATGQPLPLANIVIRGSNTGASTNENGQFTINGVAPGTYSVIVRLIGHETRQIDDVKVVQGQVTILDIELVDSSVLEREVTVYGASFKTEKVTDAPAAVSVISANEIKLNAVGGQVPRLLETQPGVDIVQSGINDFNVNTRGFNSSLNRRLLVLLDGRDLSVAFLGSQEWNGLSVPVEDLGRLELIRGPGSALYGANAFNGVINILTPRPKDITGGKMTIAGGEKNTIRTDVRYAAVTDRWSYKVNVGRFQGDSWSVSRQNLPFEYGGFNPFLNTEVLPLDRSKVSSTYGSARVDYDVTENETMTVEGGAAQVENEVLVTGIGRVQVPKAIKPFGRASFAGENLYVQAWGAGRNSIKPQVSLSTGLPLEEESFIGQVDAQYRWSAFEERLFVILGGSHRYQFVNTDRTLTEASHHDNLSGIYTQLEYRLTDELKSIVAGRLDRSTLHSSQFSPKVALVWTPIRGHSIRATFNKAFQAPNYSELFLSVKHPIRNLVYFGNDRIIVEKITGYEVGYKGVFGNSLFVTVDGYYNQLRDFITDLAPNVNPAYPGQITLPGETITRTVWSYGNAGRVNEQGIELSANYYLGSTVQLFANYAFFDFTIKEQNENDVLLPNAPDHKVNGGAAYRNGPLEAELSIKYVPGFDWAAGIYKGKILAYALVNTSVSYALNPVFTLGLSVSNILDRDHYQIFGGSLIGRRAVASVTATI